MAWTRIRTAGCFLAWFSRWTLQGAFDMHAMAVISFSYSCPPEALEDYARHFALNLKPQIDGLEWKIFLNQPELRRSAGLYCFRDIEAAHEYVDGPLVDALRRAPVVREVSAAVFQTMEEASLLSGAPLPSTMLV